MLPAFVNPAAVAGDDARRALSEAGGFDVRLVAASELGGALRLAVDRGARRVVVAGGDGSVRTAASVLAGTDVELAIVPAGTLNHRARDLGIPQNLDHAVRVSLGTQTRMVDVGRVNDRLFVNTSAVGAYVTFVRRRQRLEHWFGYRAASVMAALRFVGRPPSFRVTLHVDGAHRVYDTPLLFVGVDERELKLPRVGVRVSNGRSGLHVMVVRPISRWRIVRLALLAATRGIEAATESAALDSFIVDACRVDRPRGAIALDGELVSMRSPLNYKVQHDALRVVVP